MNIIQSIEEFARSNNLDLSKSTVVVSGSIYQPYSDFKTEQVTQESEFQVYEPWRLELPLSMVVLDPKLNGADYWEMHAMLSIQWNLEWKLVKEVNMSYVSKWKIKKITKIVSDNILTEKKLWKKT